jgi:FAD/FMN-containing dehydrogenase
MQKTGQFEDLSMPEPTVKQLRERIRGEVIRPADPEYDPARKVYNGMIDRRPAVIVRCADVADVIHAVNFARDHKLRLAVRGGGHSGPGLGTCDGGLVVDLKRMKGIRVKPADSTVRVDGGCVWGDVDHATHAFGMAVPCGFISTTGVGGLTLGGGVGYLTRRSGLTIDNLLSVDMVLADGRFVTAGPRENEDLFWAVRGGGGNFGVVTSFQFRMTPVSTVYGGPMLWPMKDAGEILRFWQDLILKAPEELNGWFGFVTVPPVEHFPKEHHLEKMCLICWCYTGDLGKAEEVFKPIRRFRAPVIDFAGPVPFPSLQSMFDALYPPGLQWYWKAEFFAGLNEEAIQLHLKHGAQLPTPHSTMHLYPTNGAAHRPGKGDTAWNFRNANFAEVIVGVDPDPANGERIKKWARAYWEALHPHSSGGAYVNMIMDEGETQVRAAYGENYDRLARIKAKYDPQNLFSVNQNIKPAS